MTWGESIDTKPPTHWIKYKSAGGFAVRYCPASHCRDEVFGTACAKAAAAWQEEAGHKTNSVFRRYDKVSPDDLRLAVERLDAATA